MSPARQAVLIDMAYEIGGAGLAGFVHMLDAMRLDRWESAAHELRYSKLYGQVPRREDQNIDILLSGEFPPGISDAAGLVRLHEGCVFTAKPDAKGKWAIGWGHDIQPPPEATSCTQEQADQWLVEDLALATARAKRALGEEFWQQESE